MTGGTWLYVLAGYLALINAITFAVYGADKRRARKDRWRVPERTLFLFDTFEGFDPAEARGQGGGFVEAHRNTSVERVLGLLPHPEKIVVRQGLFPAAAEGIEERFALVSLDVDLEESTLAGLRWFLPRMNKGACLLLHDYNNSRLPGVKAALRRFEEEQGIRLYKVPLCDVNGTLVIKL